MRRLLLITTLIAVIAYGYCWYDTRQYHSPINSGGLGLSRGEWEEKFGKATWEDSGQVAFRDQTTSYYVWFWEGNAGLIDISRIDKSAITLEAARAVIQRLLPADARLIRSGKREDYPLTDSYISESLQGRFAHDTWRDRYGEAGEFHVEYIFSGDSVERMGVRIGAPLTP